MEVFDIVMSRIAISRFHCTMMYCEARSRIAIVLAFSWVDGRKRLEYTTYGRVFFQKSERKAPVMVIIYGKKLKIAKDSLALHYIEVTLKSLT